MTENSASVWSYNEPYTKGNAFFRGGCNSYAMHPMEYATIPSFLVFVLVHYGIFLIKSFTGTGVILLPFANKAAPKHMDNEIIRTE